MKRFGMMLALASIIGGASAQTQVARRGKAMAVVVTQEGATPAELLAAENLRATLSKITGAVISIENSPALMPKNAIVVGQGPLAAKLLPDVKWSELGLEQTVLRTHGSSLVVAGGRPRGTLYAVNRLLTQFGVRYWAPWATTIPRLPSLTIEAQASSESPAYEYRDPYWFHSFDADWALHNYDNGFNTRIGEDRGGRIEYEGFVHTYYRLVPPDKLSSVHPEWFSLIDGKRVFDNAQLCTTNSALRDYVVDQVRAELKANPKARIVSVSQNDCFQPCQCDDCRALAKRQGSDSALVLDLVNYVAAKLGAEFPEVAFDTLAYQWSRKPPTDMKPLPNVIVRLCSIECNFAFPLDAPQNQSFANDVAGWSKLTNRLYIWDYCTNFAAYLAPQPDYFTFGETFRFLYDHGARGVFEEGAYHSTDSDMAELKAWVIAQLLWNPKQDEDALVREFLAGYYGKAAGPIYSYLRLMQTEAQKGPLSFAAPVHAAFLGYGNMRKAELLWQQAEALDASDPERLWRVKQSHLCVQYVWLSRWEEYQKAAKAAGDRWIVDRSRKAFASQWLAVATGQGPAGWTPLTRMTEGGGTPQEFAAQFGTDPAAP